MGWYTAYICHTYVPRVFKALILPRRKDRIRLNDKIASCYTVQSEWCGGSVSPGREGNEGYYYEYYWHFNFFIVRYLAKFSLRLYKMTDESEGEQLCRSYPSISMAKHAFVVHGGLGLSLQS